MVNEKVSIIMPTFNRGNKILPTINSILKQTYANWNLFIVEDKKSTNTSEDAVKELDNEKINYILGGKTISENRNIGIEAADGEYIAFLDSDDFWYRKNLSKKVSYLENHPSISLVFSKFKVVNYSGEVGVSRSFNVDVVEDYSKYFVENKKIHTSSVLVRKEVLEEVGGFDDSFEHWEDFDIIFRINEKKSLGFVDEVLSIYNRRKNSATYGASKKQVKYMFKLFLKHWQKLSNYEEKLSEFLKEHLNDFNI